MSSESPKRLIYQSLAEVAQAIGHEHRLELLEHIAQGERSVEELSALAGLTIANTSRHLQLLRRARLVEVERRGKRAYYTLAGDTEVVAMLKALGRVAERNVAEVRQVIRDLLDSRDAMEAVTRTELLVRLRDEAVTLLDVRPHDEFALGHLPGAVNVPLDELLGGSLASLPMDRDIVAYCRGPYCVLSFDAVAALRAKGYRIRRLEDGYPEWKAAGLDVHAGSD